MAANKRAKTLSSGLHGLANLLDEMHYNLLRSKPAPTAAAFVVVRSATTQLKTSFSGSMKSTKTITPNPNRRSHTAIASTASSSTSHSNGVVTPSSETTRASGCFSARIASRKKKTKRDKTVRVMRALMPGSRLANLLFDSYLVVSHHPFEAHTRPPNMLLKHRWKKKRSRR